MIGEHVPALSCQFKRPSNASAASSAFEPPSTTAPASNPRAEWSGTRPGSETIQALAAPPPAPCNLPAAPCVLAHITVAGSIEPMSIGFRLPCYLRLKRQLGEIDACAECQEIAVRDFLAVCRSSDDPNATIQERSKIHRIRVDSVDLDRFARRNTELQLVAVSYAFEAFLNDFIDEHPRLGSREGRADKETVLDFVLRRLRSSESPQKLDQAIEYRIHEYYRLVRNRVAHPIRVSKDDPLPKLQADCKANAEYQRLHAPNDLGHLQFDDYLLFTRASKSLAAGVCQVAPLCDEDLMRWVRQHSPKKGSANRRANAMAASLRIQFGISPERAESIVRSMNGPVA